MRPMKLPFNSRGPKKPKMPPKAWGPRPTPPRPQPGRVFNMPPGVQQLPARPPQGPSGFVAPEGWGAPASPSRGHFDRVPTRPPFIRPGGRFMPDFPRASKPFLPLEDEAPEMGGYDPMQYSPAGPPQGGGMPPQRPLIMPEMDEEPGFGPMENPYAPASEAQAARLAQLVQFLGLGRLR